MTERIYALSIMLSLSYLLTGLMLGSVSQAQPPIKPLAN